MVTAEHGFDGLESTVRQARFVVGKSCHIEHEVADCLGSCQRIQCYHAWGSDIWIVNAVLPLPLLIRECLFLQLARRRLFDSHPSATPFSCRSGMI